MQVKTVQTNQGVLDSSHDRTLPAAPEFGWNRRWPKAPDTPTEEVERKHVVGHRWGPLPWHH
jgi:hypothetical protein